MERKRGAARTKKELKKKINYGEKGKQKVKVNEIKFEKNSFLYFQ